MSDLSLHFRSHGFPERGLLLADEGGLDLGSDFGVVLLRFEELGRVLFESEVFLARKVNSGSEAEGKEKETYGWWCGFFGGGQTDADSFIWLSHAALPGGLCGFVLEKYRDGCMLSEMKWYNKVGGLGMILAGGVNPKAAVLKACSLERFDFTATKGNLNGRKSTKLKIRTMI